MEKALPEVTGDGVVRPRNLSLAEAVNDPILLRGRGLRETGGFPFFVPEGRTYSPPAKAGGGSPPVGRARALSEGDCVSCGSRWTMPQPPWELLSSPTQMARRFPCWKPLPHLPAQTCHRAALPQIQGRNNLVSTPDSGASLFTTYLLESGTPYHGAYLYERRAAAFHSSPSERMVDNGDLSFGGPSMVSRGAGALRRGRFGLSELFPDAQRLRRVQHDYTRKQGLAWQAVFLPPMAPPDWQEQRKTLERRGGSGENQGQPPGAGICRWHCPSNCHASNRLNFCKNLSGSSS